MPMLNVQVAATRSDELTGKIASTLLELTSRLLGKQPGVTAIAISYVDPRDWITGGRTLAEQKRTSFFLDVKITDETNTKAEKASYVREIFAAFARLLPDLHEESYVHVHDVRAAAYGYGGQTQEYRYHHPAA
jgi:4-oxalocrotonate tautomerase